MIPRIHTFVVPRLIAAAAALIALSACTSAPTRGALVVGQQATIEGEVVRVDTAPWTYDGNAVITLATADAGTVSVQLPARWNLCKAPPLEEVQTLKPSDRLRVIGSVTAPGEVVVCAQPQHRLHKID